MILFIEIATGICTIFNRNILIVHIKNKYQFQGYLRSYSKDFCENESE